MKAYQELYEEGFLKGYAEGSLLGTAEIIGSLIKTMLKDRQTGKIEEADKLERFLNKYYGGFGREAIHIVEKYPGYSRAHLGKKIIYENTYLPYTEEEESDDTQKNIENN